MSRFFTRKSVLSGVVLAALAAAPAWAQTVDGTRDASYGPALAVQTNATSFGNSTNGQQEQANGSELDNIHAQIVGTDLFIFIGGNLESNFNKLDIFIDSKSGGQNVLRGDNPNVDFNGLNNMAGLQFDAGFTSDYFITIGSGNNPLEVYTNIAETLTGGGGNGAFAGGGAGRTHTNLDFDPSAGTITGAVSIDNSNTAGVDGMTVGNPGAVATGIELRIPLSALGTSVNGGDIRLIAFVNNGGHTFLSNQVLAGLPAGSGNLAGPATVNFANLAGNQFVTVANGAVAMQPQISVTPTSLDFFNVSSTGGNVTRQFTIANNGAGTLSVTNVLSSNPAFTASPLVATVAPGASTTVTVTFNPSTAGLQTGTLTIASNDPATPTVTVTLRGNSVPAGQIVIDGTVDSGLYGAAKALQTTPTGFGDMTATTGGSELDGAYARVVGSDLFVTLTGNLENNGNKLVIFFDANPDTGQNTVAGNNPTVDFGSSGNLAGLRFDRGFAPESFISLNLSGSSLFANFAPLNGAGGNGTFLSAAGSGSTQTLDFGGGQFGELSLNNSNTAGVSGTAVGNPGAVQTGVELRIPLSVLGSGITATTPLHVMGLITNGAFDYLSNQTLGGLPNGTPNLGFNGASGGNPGGGATNSVDFGLFRGNQFFTAQRGDLMVADTRDIAGDYNNITITPNGQATVNSPLDVTGTLLVQTGTLGFVPLPDALVTGTGTTTVAGVLVIGSPEGISASGPTGNVQTATRNFGTGSGYAYFGAVAQITGSGLPATVGGLGVNNAAGVTLSQPVAVRQVVGLQNGNLNTNGNMLTLLSSSAGTALVNNTGGVVNGTATVQRFIDPSLNPGLGYRHYSAPVSGTTFADLATSGFSPVLNIAYNASTTPNLVRPFPNVFGYDEQRVTNNAITGIPVFDRGFFVPTGTMETGRGYTVNIAASELVDFVGPLNNGDLTKSLTRTGGAEGGWHFLGNPYPSPMDYSLVAPADRPGLEGAMYVFESTSQYGGQYRAFVNGVGGNPRIATAQGFFVRVDASQASGSMTFRNSQRLTDFTQQVTFRRGGADTRPQVRLALHGAGLRDDAYVYAENGATPALDSEFDAVKLPNSNGLNLAALVGAEAVAINGLPGFTAATVVPLQVAVPAAGTYRLEAADLLNLTGAVYLRDALTGQQIDLRQQPSYSFAATNLVGRFSLAFAPAGTALASGAALAAAQVSVYPNPAKQRFTVEVPASPKAAVRVSLFNSLGQQVRTTSQASAASGATSVAVDAAGLAAGVYTLRVQVGAAAPIAKRVVLE